jgi:hypothetical protein
LYAAASGDERLSAVNRRFTEAVCGWLGISTPLSWSTDYAAPDDRNERLLAICVELGATEYVSGPAAQSYLDVERFAAEGVKVQWADYSGYEEYPQPHPPFEHSVSVLDLLLSTGEDAPRYLKTLAEAR